MSAGLMAATMAVFELPPAQDRNGHIDSAHKAQQEDRCYVQHRTASSLLSPKFSFRIHVKTESLYGMWSFAPFFFLGPLDCSAHKGTQMARTCHTQILLVYMQ